MNLIDPYIWVKSKCYHSDAFVCLNYILQAFICTGENLYRKPNTSMWDLFEEKYNRGVKVKEVTGTAYIGL